MRKKKRYSNTWKKYYWTVVVLIFLALVLMVNFVLNNSKIFVGRNQLIDPYNIDWSLENDGSLRLNDPYYLNGNLKFIPENIDKLKKDTILYNALIVNSKTGGTLADVKYPYIIWKKSKNDTVHILKNNKILNFLVE